MSKDVDISKANAEQEEILAAISEDAICFSVTTAMPVGAALLALNQIARSFGQREKSPQEWGEELLADGMLARKRSWKYTAQTRDNKEFRKEMEDITKLFSIPPAEHPEYMKRVMARFEAEQACKARFGIQG